MGTLLAVGVLGYRLRRMLSVREVQEAPHPAVGEQARYILLSV
jgi:hypothetical protein